MILEWFVTESIALTSKLRAASLTFPQSQAAFKANSRNAGLLEDFLIRRSQHPSQGEEQLAQETLVHGTISKKTGELDTADSGAEGRAAAASASQNGTAGKGYYGWGQGNEPTATGGGRGQAGTTASAGPNSTMTPAGSTTYGATANTPAQRY